MVDGGPVIQLYFHNGKVVLRSATKNAKDPSIAQLKARKKFGEIAQNARSKKMDGALPPAAEMVAVEMKGWRSSEKRKQKKVWERELEEYMKVEETAEEVIRRLKG